jgi:preprotein translocase subunit YajC
MEALLPLIITFGLMWALLIRPQQRRVRLHQELVASLMPGDEVITTGGIVGTIDSVVDDIVTLEVAPDTAIRVLRTAVQSRISPDADEVVDDDFEEDAFDEEAFEADVADLEAPPAPPPPPTPPAPSATPPAATPPTTTPPATSPPATGEKA